MPMQAMSSSLMWLHLLTRPQTKNVLEEGMNRAAANLSKLIYRPITVEDPWVEAIPLAKLYDHIGDPEVATVGIYLLIEGELRGQSLILFSLEDALYLVGMLNGKRSGKTETLDALARSAVGEIADNMLSGFLNAVAEFTGSGLQPSPPAVMVDMAGAIVDVVAATSIVAASDHLIVIESSFRDEDRIIQCRFWVLPDPTEAG